MCMSTIRDVLCAYGYSKKRVCTHGTHQALTKTRGPLKNNMASDKSAFANANAVLTRPYALKLPAANSGAAVSPPVANAHADIYRRDALTKVRQKLNYKQERKENMGRSVMTQLSQFLLRHLCSTSVFLYGCREHALELPNRLVISIAIGKPFVMVRPCLHAVEDFSCGFIC